jgi:hypothetical protein
MISSCKQLFTKNEKSEKKHFGGAGGGKGERASRRRNEKIMIPKIE